MGRLKGEAVHVLPRLRDARDKFGNVVVAWGDEQQVDNVLVAPGKCADLDETRPEGVDVALTLHFPKAWTGRLRGAKVRLEGRWEGVYKVVGDPMPYQDANTPTSWDMPVEVEAVDG